MHDFDAQSLANQAVMLGLVTQDQAHEAIMEAEDGSVGAVTRVMLRKGYLTSWQRDRLLKGEGTGFFYGGCKVLFHLAEGTFARVYRGRRERDGKSIAIKVLRRRFTTDPTAVQRFNAEAEAGMKLRHANIVQIYDFGEQDKNYYMTMEYVEGSNLREFLKIRHRLSPEEGLPIMIGLAEGLKYSLDHGVTHRDIKGTNILIASNGEAKLVDFGLATIAGTDEKKMEAAHGVRTIDYSALERTCRSPKGDPRSDIFFLGCVYYQMLTGILPMPEVESSDMLAKMLKRSFAAIRPLAELRYAPPEEIRLIIEKMMKVDLTQRYQTMDHVLDDLKAYQQSLTSRASPEPAKVDAVAEVEEPAPGDEFDDVFAPASASEPEPEQARAVSARVEDPDPIDEFNDLVAALPESHPESKPEPARAARTVLCVEVQDQIRKIFHKALSGMGYRVVLAHNAKDAAKRVRESLPDVVLYDADGLGPRALDDFLDMHAHARKADRDLAALVLLGPRQRELAGKLPTNDRVVVLAKPVKMKEIQHAMAQLVPLN
ncbi:MAG: protein kinase [Isosphaeraceae bacterium]